MNATPRTNAVCWIDYDYVPAVILVEAKFARQLETELTTALERVRELEKIEQYVKSHYLGIYLEATKTP